MKLRRGLGQRRRRSARVGGGEPGQTLPRRVGGRLILGIEQFADHLHAPRGDLEIARANGALPRLEGRCPKVHQRPGRRLPPGELVGPELRDALVYAGGGLPPGGSHHRRTCRDGHEACRCERVDRASEGAACHETSGS